MPGLGFWSISSNRLVENKKKWNISGIPMGFAVDCSASHSNERTPERHTALRFTYMHIHYIPDCIIFYKFTVKCVYSTMNTRAATARARQKKKIEFTNEEIWNYFYIRFVSVLGNRHVWCMSVWIWPPVWLAIHTHPTIHSLTQCTRIKHAIK